VARFSNGLILLVAILIMVNLRSIQATWFISLVFGAGIGGVLMLRWLWDRINLYSEVAAIATSLVVAPLILATVQTEWIRLALVVVASLGAAVGITFVTPLTDPKVLARFRAKVRPVGWWRTPAPDGSVREFGRRLKWTGLMTVSLFSILIGLVRILIPLPWVSAWWGWGALVCGVILTPSWWRPLRAKTFAGPPATGSE
jgi:hypothetical protein